MHANGSALDLIAKAIEDLLGSSSLLDATNSGSDGRASRTLASTSGGSTCSHVRSTTCSLHLLSLFLFFIILSAHAWDSGARGASLSIGSAVVAVATAKAE